MSAFADENSNANFMGGLLRESRPATLARAWPCWKIRLTEETLLLLLTQARTRARSSVWSTRQRRVVFNRYTILNLRALLGAAP